MTLVLDHTQRLNIIALLDLVECKNRREAWAVCKLQETLDLNDQEREVIGLSREVTSDGQQFVRWDLNKTIDRREYHLSEEDIQRITQALDKIPSYVLGRDRWFKPLQAQLPEPIESNGAQPKEEKP